MLAAELVLGLLFLHEHGIVHQDIKPANVMVSAAGHAVIGEFGAARTLPLVSGNDNRMPNTPNTSFKGNPTKYGPIVRKQTESITFTSLYAAPELSQATSDNLIVYDQSVDFWSLGVLLHEVATGELPFDLVSESRSREASTVMAFRIPERFAIAGNVDEGWDILLEDLERQVSTFCLYIWVFPWC